MTITQQYDAIDQFAGPGGWDVGARQLGLTTLGIEYDDAACETRRAAGLATIQGDVRAYSPKDFFDLLHRGIGLISSPPCQTFSMAGGGAGRAALEHVLAGIKALQERRMHDHVFDDERTALVLEPLRWAIEALDLGAPFEWSAFEQVPTVLPVWQAMAEVLRAEGYSVAVGYVYAEQHDVPQTRKRAVLVARLHGEAKLPTPTRSRYNNRHPELLEPGLPKWISMAEALGWDDPVTMRSNYGTGGDPANRGERTSDQPAPTVTSKIGRNKWSTGDAVTLEEAAILQGLPGHPWQGNKGKQMEQIGNMIPPPLARAVLASATGIAP